MLYSMVVNFKAQADAVISPTRGYHAYALFLDLLRSANPEVAQHLHDLQTAKPFTLSPLQGRFRRLASGLKLVAGETYWIRFTFLQEDIFAYFMDALLKAGDKAVRLDQATLQIERIITVPGVSPLCNCQDFDSILAQALSKHEITLSFLSPTTFRSGGKRNVMFPEPRLLFNSYLSKWQSFAPCRLDDDLATISEKGARVAKYKLETRILHFGSYQEIGFEGECTIEIAPEIPQEALISLNALADFAFYCGSGAKTAMGMGQTRRLNNARPLSGRARRDPEEG